MPPTTPSWNPVSGGIDGQSTTDGEGGKAAGALQLSARTRLTLNGRILANGGGGKGATGGSGGGGGASGGTVLLEAPTVVVRGGLFANGGGGGGGGGLNGSTIIPGQEGETGTFQDRAATGGAGGDGQECVLLEKLVGGDGGGGGTHGREATVGQRGAERSCGVEPLSTIQRVWPGGGGGAVGVTRIHAVTRDTTGATFSPQPSTGDLEVW